MLTGCNYIIFLSYIIGGPPSIAPDFDEMTNKSMTDKDIRVAIVCDAPTEVRFDFDEIHREVAKYLTFKLHEHQITVINPDRVRAWLDENPEWDRAEEIGEAFETDYVVYIDLHKFSLFEENSANLYRGRAEALVSVFEMDEEGNGEKIYDKEMISKFPLHAARSTSEVSYEQFKRQYLSRFGEELGRLFYEHYNGDDIPDAI